MSGTAFRTLLLLVSLLLAGTPAASAEDSVTTTAGSAAEPEMVPGQDWRGRPISGEERLWMLRSDRRFPAETTEKVLREVAAELPVLAVGGVLYERSSHVLPEGLRRDEYDEMLGRVQDPRHDVGVLERLSRDEDPRVSVLAIVSLFSRDDPHKLPVIAERLSDRRQAIPNVTFVGCPTPSSPPGESYVETIPQTVADVARAMIRFYLRQSRHRLGSAIEDSFQEWWTERKDRDECIGWLRVRLQQAKDGFVSAQPDSRQALMLLYRRIRRLPEVYRELTMISILDDGAIFRVTRPGFPAGGGLEQELVYAARRLYTSGRLLPLMEGTETIDDPDWSRHGLVLFVMRHAAEVLRPEDVPALLAWREQFSAGDVAGQLMSDWLAVGAARLQPRRAAELLVPLLDRAGRITAGGLEANVPVEVWRLCGSAQAEQLLEWFYKAIPANGLDRERREFLAFLCRRFNENDRRWLVSMVLDERFEGLRWGTLREMAHALNRNVMPPVIPIDVLERTRWSWVEDALLEDSAAAQEKYPEKSAELLRMLPDWQRRFRQTVAPWATDGVP